MATGVRRAGRRARAAAAGSRAVDQRHPQVEDDRVGMASPAAAQARFGVDGRPDLIAFEPQHPRKRLRHAFVVVDDEDRGRRGSDVTAGTLGIVTDDAVRYPAQRQRATSG